MVISFIRKSIYPFRHYLIGSLVWIIYLALYGSLQPYLIKLLIDTAKPGGGAAEVQELFKLSGYFIALLVSYDIVYQFYDWCDMRLKPALKNHIAVNLMGYLIDHDYNFYQTRFTGNIVAKLNDLINLTPDVIRVINDNYITNGASVLVGTYLLWTVHAGFAIALLLWVLAFSILSLSTLNRFKFLSHNTAESSSKIIGIIVDQLNNILNIKFFASKAHELSWLTNSLNEYAKAFKKRRMFIFKLYSAQAVSYQVYQATCLILLIYLYGYGKVTAGDFAMILTLNLWIISCMWDMSDRVRLLSENWGAIDQALRAIYVPPTIKDAPHAKELEITKGEIIFDDVSFVYPDGTPLFDHLSVAIRPSEKVGLVGYSGSGKTTFINLLLRIFEPTSGRILIDGQDIQSVTQDSLHKAIGINPQDVTLFYRSIMENIRYGKQEATDEEIQEVVRRVHADKFIAASSEGYNMMVGERGTKLSGGQRQRIAMARVILKNAPIFILDEATSQLDSETERFIQESLADVMEGKTALVIAHRLSTLLHLDRILVFDRGAVVQNGIHTELIKQDGLYKTLWENQQSGFIPERKKT